MASHILDQSNENRGTFTLDGPLNLLVVVGSTREGRLGLHVSRWFVEQAKRRSGLEVEILDLAEARLPEVLTSDPPAVLQPVTRRLERADAFVLITPEYNHSFPAPLKTLIDWHSTEWHAKPVGFVSYGGRSGGIRAVEHLRQVFAELHAVTVRDAVSLADIWRLVDKDGLRRPEGGDKAAEAMLAQIAWWGRTLRAARVADPYLT